MIKSILVTVAGTPQTGTALDTAVILGRSFGAHIECLRVHPDPAQLLAQAAAADMGSGLAVASVWQALQEDDVRRTKSARDAFDKVCERETIVLADRPGTVRGMSASWREVTGDEIECVVARARVSDLVVIEHSSGGGGFQPLAAGALLFGAGRPLLVSPPKSSNNLTGKIAVAWKDSAEAAKALAAALPILSKAAEVVILGVNEDARQLARLRASLDSAVNFLAWHDVPAESLIIELRDKPAADSMLIAAEDARADLLVMGGYGHGRFRELIFGGFTRHVLTGVSLPVFLFH